MTKHSTFAQLYNDITSNLHIWHLIHIIHQSKFIRPHKSIYSIYKAGNTQTKEQCAFNNWKYTQKPYTCIDQIKRTHTITAITYLNTIKINKLFIHSTHFNQHTLINHHSTTTQPPPLWSTAQIISSIKKDGSARGRTLMLLATYNMTGDHWMNSSLLKKYLLHEESRETFCYECWQFHDLIYGCIISKLNNLFLLNFLLNNDWCQMVKDYSKIIMNIYLFSLYLQW